MFKFEESFGNALVKTTLYGEVTKERIAKEKAESKYRARQLDTIEKVEPIEIDWDEELRINE